MIINFNGGGGGKSAKLEHKDYNITENGVTPIVPSEKFDGIFEGDITVDVRPKLQKKTVDITGNGTTTVTPDEGNYGMSKVTVNTKVTSTGSQIDITGTGWENGEKFFPVDLSRSASLNDDIEYTRTKFSEWNPSETSLSRKYNNDENLVYAPKIDTSAVTNMYYCFYYCTNLTSIPELNTSAVENMNSCFYSCKNLTTIPELNTSAVENMNCCFFDCKNLITIPELNTSNVTDMNYCFNGCSNLTNLGGFAGLKVSLSLYGDKLTKQSLLNVIAGLATVTDNPTLEIGSKNLAKLTEDEIAVATGKGWTVE